jgi:hypothetical protein
MCNPIDQLDKRSRRLRAIANVSLVLGLLPYVFRESIHLNPNWLHAFCGFFVGLSITMNLFVLHLSRRCRENRI